MFRWYQPDLSIKNSIANKLRRTTNEETVRWADNAHTGLGKNLSEMRKSLARGDVDQTLVYIADSKQGAVMMLSALEIMEDRLRTHLPDTPQTVSLDTPSSSTGQFRLVSIPRL